MPRAASSPPTGCARSATASEVSLAGLVLIRQRPGSAKGVCFITLEDETGIANLVVWPDRFAAQRSIVMGARLMVVHGIVQHDEAVVHVIASRLEDDTHMLRHLSEDALPDVTSRGDGGGAMAPLLTSRADGSPAQRALPAQEPRFPLGTLAAPGEFARCQSPPSPCSLAAQAASPHAHRSTGAGSTRREQRIIQIAPCGDQRCGTVEWASAEAQADAHKNAPKLVGTTLL